MTQISFFQILICALAGIGAGAFKAHRNGGWLLNLGERCTSVHLHST